MMICMGTDILVAIEGLEKENANLEPELLTTAAARELMAAYARAEKLVAFGIAALSHKLDDSAELARVTGSSVGKAKSVVATGRVMAASEELSAALQQGDISLDQAVEIAAAEESAPGTAAELVTIAQEESFHVLKEKARQKKLEAEQHRDLAARQHAARRAHSHCGELGMMHIHIELEPHVGAPIVARAEAEGQRLARKAKGAGADEPFHRHLADAYASLLAGLGSGRAKRPELVVLVSHEVAKRGWTDVRGRGLQDPRRRAGRTRGGQADRQGCLFKRRLLRRQGPQTVQALVTRHLDRAAGRARAGEGPGFNGVLCTDCGNRFRTEFDHQVPRIGRPQLHRKLEAALLVVSPCQNRQ